MKLDLLLTSITTPLMVPALSHHFTVHVLPTDTDWRPGVMPVAERIRALVTTTFVGAEADLINALPNLDVVVNAGGHTDTTDVAAIGARNVPMAYTPALTREDVADVGIRAGPACRPAGLRGRQVRPCRALAVRIHVVRHLPDGQSLWSRGPGNDRPVGGAAGGGLRHGRALPWPTA